MITNSLKYWDIKARVINHKIYMEYANKITGRIYTVVKPLQEIAIDNMPTYSTTNA